MAKKKSSSTVRVGIVGVGIGRAHIQGYQKGSNVEITALCDINEARAHQVAAETGLGEISIFADHRSLLDSSLVDAVSVGVPNAFHRPIAVDCLNAGKHVLCEKPLAINAREGQKIADAAAKNKVKCMVAQVLRFRDDSRYLKSAIASGELGRIYFADTGSLRRRGIPGYGGWFTTKEVSGGGPLIDIGVHVLDLTWWLSGCPKPIAVTGITYAEFGRRRRGISPYGSPNLNGTFDVEDLAVGIIRFENGLTINLQVAWAINSPTDRQWCRLYGTEGGGDWGDNVHIAREIAGKLGNAKVDVPPGDMWKNETQHFIDSILNDTAPDPDVTQGVQMMKMLDGIYKSAETGREVLIK